MGGMIHWFTRNHVAANFLMILLLLAGLTTWFKIKKEIFPETSLDAVQIQVPFPNATPEDVEKGILLPLEDAIADVDGVDRYTSSALENMGAVTVEVASGYDVREVMGDLKSQVDAVSNFPESSEEPILKEFVITAQVMTIAITADTDEKTLKQIGEQVRDGLLEYKPGPPVGTVEKVKRLLTGDADITKVSLSAVRPYEIGIEISAQTLRDYGLTLREVAQKIRQTSLDLPGGSIREKSGEIIVRADAKVSDAEDFKKIVIAQSNSGAELRLEDIATIVDGFENVDIRSRFDGKNSIMINVYRTGEQDTIMVADAVKDYIENVAPVTLPEGVDLTLWSDGSEMLQGRMDLLARNGATGLLYVFIVLALFLRPSLAFLVALGIPVSFAGGVWLMPELGVSVNMISLFAFILVLGIVVDDAIVVGENVYSRIRKGEHPRDASWKGTHEVGVVVIFGIMTTMAAFTPMLGLSGVSGKIWPNIPLIVIPVLAFSLIQSKLVLPAHLAFLKPHNPEGGGFFLFRLQRSIADGLEWFIQTVYRPALLALLKFRYILVAVFCAVLMIVGGYVAGGWIKSTFMPKVEGDVLSAKLTMPVGVQFELTNQALSAIERAALEVGEELRDVQGNSVVRHYQTTAGSQPFLTGFTPANNQIASHLGEVTLELSAAAERDHSGEEIIALWREKVGEIAGAVELSFRQETSAGGNAIDIEVTGRDMDQLAEASLWITQELEKINGVKDITTDNREGKQEVVFKKLTAAGRSLGFTLESVALQVRAAFYGDEVQRIQRGRDEVKVLVRYPKGERESLETLEEVRLIAPDGSEVPIGEVVESIAARGPATIHRVNGKRSVKIQADVDRSSANANEVVAKFTEEVLGDLENKFPGVRYDYLGEQKDQQDSMREMSLKAVFALLLIYILMAIPLRSYFQPLIIMSVIPFGILGAVFGHWLLDLELSIMSMCGIVALSGVVVNDSLVLVEYVNRKRAEGIAVFEAVRLAGLRRFRPILLTSLTTFAGLVPMLSETDMQAKFLIPMAVSLAFGILFATVITLFLVPCVYLILEDIKRLFSKIWSGMKWIFGSSENV